MPERRPPAADLVEVVREYLEREVLPGLTGDRRFDCRVAINVLGIVRRELERGPAADAGEAARLRALLGRDGTVDELNRVLVERLRAGALDLDDPRLRDHLRRTVVDALGIDNPRWLETS